MFSSKQKRKVDSKAVGLEIGLLIFKFFLKTEYLHYGYFVDDLEVDITNIKKAQENYTKLLFAHIPEGTKTILDVGCGSGKIAQELIAQGYKVDCVSPSSVLTDYAKRFLGDSTLIYQCKFEDMMQKKKYDLILFSESFQYIPMEKSILMALGLLNEKGSIMICDFFKNDPERKSKLGGGHSYDQWLVYKASLPLKTIIEKDITIETAPTIDLANQLNMEVLKPIWASGWALGVDRFPFMFKLAKIFYPKKLDKLRDKFFTSQQTGENFIKYKRYMFYLFQTFDDKQS